MDCRPVDHEPRRPQPEIVASWRTSIEDGTASARCDETVRRLHADRGIPMKLVEAILRERAVARIAT